MNQSLSEFIVSQEEQGVKLLRFLALHLQDASQGMLHKWIRSGQVRVNGKRCKAFDILMTNDRVRIPPFASRKTFEQCNASLDTVPDIGKDLQVLGLTERYMLVGKPAGLAVQGGSKIKDSVVGRLKSAYAGKVFTPAPVHRLDRQSSGLLLIGRTQQSLCDFSALFAATGTIEKTYLAIVKEPWHTDRAQLLLDRLEPVQAGRAEFMSAVSEGLEISSESIPGCTSVLAFGENCWEYAAKLVGKHSEQFTQLKKIALVKLQENFNAACVVLPLCKVCYAGQSMVLLGIRLLTGRKHQLRVQLSSRGFPILGDTRYGGNIAERLYLHAWQLRLPDGSNYVYPPDWDNFVVADALAK